MKILRSQYLQLQNGSDRWEMIASNNGIGKLVRNNSKEYANGKETLPVAEERICNRRKSITSFSGTSIPNTANINILFDNVNASFRKLNLILEYTDMSALWLTSLYKTYENDLWSKKPRLDIHGNRKWNFHCGLCSNVYKAFESAKNHLNLHLNYYPYVCKMCLKKYTGRKSATRHLNRTHHIKRRQWNDFLTG